MHERLLDKNVTPTTEECCTHIGNAAKPFEHLDAFLISELYSEKRLKYCVHDRCWAMAYHIKNRFVCDIYFEKEAFTLITRLPDEGLNNVYNDISPYAKECIDNSPYRHRGWIEYRVFSIEHLDVAKKMVRVRVNCKP